MSDPLCSLSSIFFCSGIIGTSQILEFFPKHEKMSYKNKSVLQFKWCFLWVGFELYTLLVPYCSIYLQLSRLGSWLLSVPAVGFGAPNPPVTTNIKMCENLYSILHFTHCIVYDSYYFSLNTFICSCLLWHLQRNSFKTESKRHSSMNSWFFGNTLLFLCLHLSVYVRTYTLPPPLGNHFGHSVPFRSLGFLPVWQERILLEASKHEVAVNSNQNTFEQYM